MNKNSKSFSSNQSSSLINIEDFEDYVKHAKENGLFLDEFELLNDLPHLPHKIGSSKQNIHKNRYTNVIAYDATRVKLDSINDDIDNKYEYINANYITGFNKKPTYIATQAPMATTLRDFWKMIWQENVPCIVNLTKITEDNKVKCHKYWPNDNETFDSWEFKITCTSSKSIQTDLTVRTLNISFDNKQRELTQIHYEGWLAFKTPHSMESVKKILDLMNGYEDKGGRIVVHCSAGVGRTGSLILCDTAIKMAKATTTVDVYLILYQLRLERMRMICNIKQYENACNIIAYVLKNM